jgi:IclR family acetate operon transcriptional repressor
VESDQFVRYSANIGELCILHGGASGTLLMAGMTKKELDAYEKEIGFSKLTENTITDRITLDKAIKKAKNDGYCASFKERRNNTAGIGVPIFDYNNRVVACLNITLPAERYNPGIIPSWVEILKKAGVEISKKNGYPT